MGDHGKGRRGISDFGVVNNSAFQLHSWRAHFIHSLPQWPQNEIYSTDKWMETRDIQKVTSLTKTS